MSDSRWNPVARRGTQIILRPQRVSQPLRWRDPRRVQVSPDLFHETVPDGYIARVWDVMGQAGDHTFEILANDQDRMRAWVQRWADVTGDSEVSNNQSGLPPMPRGPEAVRATYRSGRALLFAAMLDSMGEPPEGYAYPAYDWIEGQRWWPATLTNVTLGGAQ